MCRGEVLKLRQLVSLRLVVCASRYMRVKQNQLDAQFIFSIFRRHLYMFRVYLLHIIKRYTVWVQQLVRIVLFR